MFRIGEIMALLRHSETWPEFSEFKIISTNIGETNGEINKSVCIPIYIYDIVR